MPSMAHSGSAIRSELPLPAPKSDISDFGHVLESPNSDKSEFGGERVGVRGFGYFRIALPEPPHPTFSQAGRRSETPCSPHCKKEAHGV